MPTHKQKVDFPKITIFKVFDRYKRRLLRNQAPLFTISERSSSRVFCQHLFIFSFNVTIYSQRKNALTNHIHKTNISRSPTVIAFNELYAQIYIKHQHETCSLWVRPNRDM